MFTRKHFAQIVRDAEVVIHRPTIEKIMDIIRPDIEKHCTNEILLALAEKKETSIQLVWEKELRSIHDGDVGGLPGWAAAELKEAIEGVLKAALASDPAVGYNSETDVRYSLNVGKSIQVYILWV